MRLCLTILIAPLLLSGCIHLPGNTDTIYASDAFVVTTDRVEQGDYVVELSSTPDGGSAGAVFRSPYPLINSLFAAATKSLDAGELSACETYLALSRMFRRPDETLSTLRRRATPTLDVADRPWWPLAAWELYAVTADDALLAEALRTTDAIVAANIATSYSSEQKLLCGVPDHLAAEAFPLWMNVADRFASYSLTTNVLAARAIVLRQAMADRTQRTIVAPSWELTPAALANSINASFWSPTSGHYCAYLYGGVYPIQAPLTDNLGQALAITTGIANKAMARSVIDSTPMSVFGVTPTAPPTPSLDETSAATAALWTMAAAAAGSMQAVELNLAALFRLAAMAREPRASAAAIDAAVTRVVMGVRLTPDSICFAPFVPHALDGEKSLSGLLYHNAVINLRVIGSGVRVKSMSVNGVPSRNRSLPASFTGTANVTIIMDDQPTAERRVTIVPPADMPLPPTPTVVWTDSSQTAIITNITSPAVAGHYDVYVNSGLVARTSSPAVDFDSQGAPFSLVDVVAVCSKDAVGFSARPHEYIPPKSLIVVPAKAMGGTGTRFIASPDSARLWAELSTLRQPRLQFGVNAPHSGTYFVDIDYSNGSPDCAARMLVVDALAVGSFIMPPTGRWGDTARSNMIAVTLHRGYNRLTLGPLMGGDSSQASPTIIKSMRIISKK